MSINKLGGFSFGQHHWNESYRFGWRPDKEVKNILIFPYYYQEGKRVKYESHICSCLINERYIFKIIFDNNRVTYEVIWNDLIIGFFSIEVCNFKMWGYTLGLYFGGVMTAPHKMKFLEILK